MHHLLQLLRWRKARSWGSRTSRALCRVWNDGYVSYYDLCPAIFRNFRRLA